MKNMRISGIGHSSVIISQAQCCKMLKFDAGNKAENKLKRDGVINTRT